MNENKNTSHPKTALRLLSWFCPDYLYEEIEGDLIQRFNRDVKTLGENRAKRRLLWNSVRFLRPGIVLRNKFSFESNSIMMILNYFKIAIRHLLRDKAFSMINISGLAVGIVAFFMIVQYADFETSFDQFHTNKKEVYRVALKRYEHGELVNASAKSYVGVYHLLNQHFPELKAVTRFYKMPANTGVLFKHKQKIYNENVSIISADSNFFKVFPSLLIKGNPTEVLSKPNSIVISQALAKKVFGEEDPIGQELDQWDENESLPSIVTGVLDIPPNSHLHADIVEKLGSDWNHNTADWTGSFLFNYVALSKEASPILVSEKLNHLMDDIEKQFPVTKGTALFLQPIEDIHLKSQLKDEYELNGSQTLVYALLAIAFVIIVVAWINYVNIEIARFLKRSKEVGVRRIVGSDKLNIALQFLIEYCCITVASFTIAFLILLFVSPQLEVFTGITLHKIQWPLSSIVLKAFCFFIAGSLIVGIYPAFFLLKLNPVAILKGNFGGVNRGKGIRRSLIIVQFSTSLFLIAFLLIVDHQLDFLRSADKKVEVEQVVTLLNPIAYAGQEVKSKHDNFRRLEQRLLQNPSIQMVSSSSSIPGQEIGFTFVDLIKKQKEDAYDPTRYKTLFVGENFIPLYGLRLIAGRNFDTSNEDWAEPWQRRDWYKIILNEKATRQLGFSSPEKAINQVVKYRLWNDDFEDYEIIGVIEDYHHEAAKEEVLPMILSINYNSFQQTYYSVLLAKNTYSKEALSFIEKSWKEVFPDYPFAFFFLNEYYDRQFKSELEFERIFTLFAGVALFLSCLGVFGVSLFEVNNRLKEISIRKVLGASVESLVALLSKENLRIALLSFLFTGPAIYYIGNQWLSAYPLRISLGYLFFLIPIVLLVIIILTTSSIQIIKAANSNPVNHLKNE